MCLCFSEQEYEHEVLLEQANKDDFADLEMLQFLQTGNWSIKNMPVVLVIGKHLPVAVVSPERLYRYNTPTRPLHSKSKVALSLCLVSTLGSVRCFYPTNESLISNNVTIVCNLAPLQP